MSFFKSRSLAVTQGKIHSGVSFQVAGQQILTVQEEPVKRLGRVFDKNLKNRNLENVEVKPGLDWGSVPYWKIQRVASSVCSPTKAKVAVNDEILWDWPAYTESDGEAHQLTHLELAGIACRAFFGCPLQ